jgi:hypothetical protein
MTDTEVDCSLNKETARLQSTLVPARLQSTSVSVRLQCLEPFNLSLLNLTT